MFFALRADACWRRARGTLSARTAAMRAHSPRFPGSPVIFYLGTTNSWLYESTDEGATWHRLAKLGPADGLVLDTLLSTPPNPATIYVGAWKDSDGGGLWISHDARQDLDRAGAHSKGSRFTLCAGAFRSAHPVCRNAARRLPVQRRRRDLDADQPARQPEIHEMESLAVDPDEPRHRLRRHLASALEDHRRRQELGQHQAGTDRRLRRVLDHRRSRAHRTSST